MNDPLNFLQDVLNHYRDFASSRGINSDDLHVRVVLADGSSYVLRGIRVTAPATAGGSVLIESNDPKVTDALAVREQHVVKVEFAPRQPEPSPIGLHTEAGRG